MQSSRVPDRAIVLAGVAVTFVFFITDCLFAIVMMVAWELPWYLSLAFFIFFGALDGVYLSATLNKVAPNLHQLLSNAKSNSSPE